MTPNPAQLQDLILAAGKAAGLLQGLEQIRPDLAAKIAPVRTDLARAEDLRDLAAQLRPDHADTVRSVAASLQTIADGQVPITPAPATGYRLIYVAGFDEEPAVSAILNTLLPAVLSVLRSGAEVISFGLIHGDKVPYILADRPVGAPERTSSLAGVQKRHSRLIEGCSVEWVGYDEEVA